MESDNKNDAVDKSKFGWFFILESWRKVTNSPVVEMRKLDEIGRLGIVGGWDSSLYILRDN